MKSAELFRAAAQCVRESNFGAAAACYRQILADDPECASAYAELGNCLLMLHIPQEAAVSYTNAIRVGGETAELNRRLGISYLATRNLGEALRAFRRALEQNPDQQGVYGPMGTVLFESGHFDLARNCYRLAIEQDPSDLESLVRLRLSVPIVYSSSSEVTAYRERFAAGLSKLNEEFSTPETASVLLPALSVWTNFYLHYHGQNDLSLQRQYGALLTRALETSVPFSRKKRARGEKLRVGYISGYFQKHHAIWRMVRGIFKHHDRNEFDVRVYCIGNLREDSVEDLARLSVTPQRVPADAAGLIDRLRAEELDVAVFADIGMLAAANVAACARVAPTQCAYYGHPVTTGLQAIDYFLSCRAMDPANAQEHFSEKLIPMSGIGQCHIRPVPRDRRPTRGRDVFGLKPERFYFLCSQSPFKYVPENDGIFPEIAARAANVGFVFLAHPVAAHVTEQWAVRLKEAFQRRGLEFERHCVFLPHLWPDEYFDLVQCSDAFLDNPSWSGGNTSLDAFACGLPVITLPGQMMRGRHTYAMLKLLELDECIAEGREQYAALAARLANDPALVAAVRSRIDDRVDKVLFERVDFVRELEAFYRSVVETA